MQLLNTAIDHLEAGEVYCEVGCRTGANLIAALLKHPDAMAYAIETTSEPELQESILTQLADNLAQFELIDQVLVCPQRLDEFLNNLQESGLEDKIGIYFYDGDHDYRSQLLALLRMLPFLADQALIILSQANSSLVRQATWDFLAMYPQASLELDLPPGTEDGFWQGLLVLGWDQSRTEPSQELTSLPQEAAAIAAMQQLAQEYQQTHLEAVRQQAVKLHVAGQYTDAERLYREYLVHYPNHAETWLNLGMLLDLMQHDEAALVALERSLALNPTHPTAHHIHGLVLQRLGQVPAAIAAFQKAITFDASHVDALNQLGELFASQEALAEAEDCYRRALAVNPNHVASHLNLGDLLMKQQQYAEAIAAYRQALNFNPKGFIALEKLQQAYAATGEIAKAHYCAGYALYRRGEHEAALAEFLAFLQFKPLISVEEHLTLYDCFHNCGQTEAGLPYLRQAAERNPEDQFLQVLPDLALPFLYRSPEEMTIYRQRFTQAYNRLMQVVETADRQNQTINITSIKDHNHFYLCYHGMNDRDVHAQYGQLLHRVVTNLYPQWSHPLPMPPLSQTGKIRIGYIADALGSNSMTRWVAGWLKNHDRNQFDIHCYSLSTSVDLQAARFQAMSDQFQVFSGEINSICQKILDDQLHILVFLAIGTSHQVAQIASLRLAPIQCSAWGHPVTSGLVNIDYFLSGELMEPATADAHYTEQLIRLPNLGISYPQPSIPAPTKARADFGIPEEAIVYLSCQLMFKYLPQHDAIFPAIAQRVPQAKFVFVLRSTLANTANPGLEVIFRQRIDQAFTAAGLSSEDYCLFIPGQSWEGYTSLLQCSDVFLDTLLFSAGHTAFDAIAANLPIVTHAGELMRGRQTYGMLTRLGVTDTIAHTEAEYIDIAVRLGLELAWRHAIAQQMQQGHAQLFDDSACVVGLEQFYRQAVQEKLSQQSREAQFATPKVASKQLLHVGCGPYHPLALPPLLRTGEWQEVRLDIDPEVEPDIVSSITHMPMVADRTFDAVYSSHNLEHLYAHEVPLALSEFYRVLKPGGFALITLPDIQKIAEQVAQGHWEDTSCVTYSGPLSPVDMVYGQRSAIAAGRVYMAHKTGFTAATLRQKLEQVGFQRIDTQTEDVYLWAMGYK
jgi:predicted O-linked N-acetylglucosamine transferase (SPINDLY family)